jgi:hypothetical protein
MRAATILASTAIFAVLVVPAAANGAILVTPSNPTTFQNVRIQLTNQYFSETIITSANIVRSGNQFIINQSVSESCFLPSAPILTSTFDVGVLPVGTYAVVANIQNTRPCGNYTAVENAAFSVFAPQSVPVGSTVGYIIASSLIAFFGIWKLRGHAMRMSNRGDR